MSHRRSGLRICVDLAFIIVRILVSSPPDEFYTDWSLELIYDQEHCLNFNQLGLIVFKSLNIWFEHETLALEIEPT